MTGRAPDPSVDALDLIHEYTYAVRDQYDKDADRTAALRRRDRATNALLLAMGGRAIMPGGHYGDGAIDGEPDVFAFLDRQAGR